jgi:hypothetical protein
VNYFGATYRNRDIYEYTLPKGKVRYDWELHCREVARWAGYTWMQFLELESDEQVATLAHYDVIHTIQSVENYEQYKQSKRRQR